MSGRPFTGFPNEALDFYDDLEADPTKSFWTAHRHVYEEAVRAPMLALTAELAEEFGEPKVYRPYRDVRFSRDKTPYKDHQGASCGEHYVQVDAGGLLVAAGHYQMSAEQLERYRAAVDDEARGRLLADIVEQLERDGHAIAGEQLKTKPRGYPADHPRIDLLRRKSLYAWRRYDGPPWLATAETAAVVRADWRAYAPLVGWLTDAVGPAGA